MTDIIIALGSLRAEGRRGVYYVTAVGEGWHCVVARFERSQDAEELASALCRFLGLRAYCGTP